MAKKYRGDYLLYIFLKYGDKDRLELIDLNEQQAVILLDQFDHIQKVKYWISDQTKTVNG